MLYTVDKYTVRVSRVSGDERSFAANVSYPESQAAEMPPSVCFLPGQYVACLPDSTWWLGCIMEADNEQDDVQMTFLHPHGPATIFCWSRCKDVCWIPKAHVCQR